MNISMIQHAETPAAECVRIERLIRGVEADLRVIHRSQEYGINAYEAGNATEADFLAHGAELAIEAVRLEEALDAYRRKLAFYRAKAGK